jgi:hypothetical protein
MCFSRPCPSRPPFIPVHPGCIFNTLFTRLDYARPMPPPEPQQQPQRPTSRRAALRADLLPSAAVGAIMGLIAMNEGSGVGVAVVVGVVGCGVVLGMLALRNVFSHRG